MKISRPVNLLELVVIASIVVVVLVITLLAYLDSKDPCIKRGPKEIAYYQKIGSMIVPIYDDPCIQRASEVSK